MRHSGISDQSQASDWPCGSDAHWLHAENYRARYVFAETAQLFFGYNTIMEQVALSMMITRDIQQLDQETCNDVLSNAFPHTSTI
eukprot:659775-Amphidinium_carterae.2